MTKESANTEPYSEESIQPDNEIQLFRAVFNNTFDMMAVLLPDSTLLDINQPAVESVGTRRDDVIGKPFCDTSWLKILRRQQKKSSWLWKLLRVVNLCDLMLYEYRWKGV